MSELFPPPLAHMNADLDLVKDYALVTCKSAFEMDLHEISASLDKWKFEIEDFEMLHDGQPALLILDGTLPLYMVWLECECDFELAKDRLSYWLWELDKYGGFSWNGKWSFIVRFTAPANPPLTRVPCRKEFTFSVEKSWRKRGYVNTLCGASPHNITQKTKAK